MNLKQLSNLLNLSQTTVSRALNGYPEVSEQTRKRVLQAAMQHGYAPNARARGLATGRTHAVGHVIPTRTEHEMVNPVFADFMAGASEIYSRENYDMHLTVVPDIKEADAYRTIASRKSVDGVIVHAPLENDPRIALLTEIGMPFVVHGRWPGADEDCYAWVDVDNRQAFYRATQHLLELGHTRIGLLNGIESMDFAIRRREGVVSALRDANIAVDFDIFASADMTEDYGYVQTKRMLASENPPTALLASSIIVAYGIRRACDEAALRIGRDLSVVVHDDHLSFFVNGNERPIYTAVRSSVRDAGKLCAEILMERIADPDAPPRHVLLEAELIVGPSTGPAIR